MLLPIFSTATPQPGLLPAILFEQERAMPHGFFGDRDAGPHAGTRRTPPGCGLFGRIGDAPPPRPADPPNPGERPLGAQEPRGRA